MYTLTTEQTAAENEAPAAEAVVYFKELMELFSTPQDTEVPLDIRQGRIEEELDRWMSDPSPLRRTENGVPESILAFWRRESESATYAYLPRVARILFAVPASSA